MKKFSMEVRRARIEALRFDVEAENSTQAHAIAEKQVRANKHTAESLEDRVTVVACH